VLPSQSIRNLFNGIIRTDSSPSSFSPLINCLTTKHHYFHSNAQSSLYLNCKRESTQLFFYCKYRQSFSSQFFFLFLLVLLPCTSFNPSLSWVPFFKQRLLFSLSHYYPTFTMCFETPKQINPFSFNKPSLYVLPYY